ncbi:MAG: CBS domain-containing protein [Candidatus Melainabacteria bacterium]
MRLFDFMNTTVWTVTPDDDAETAWELMTQNDIHHLVVLDHQRVVGVITDTDLGGPNGEDLRAGCLVADLMTKNPLTVPAATTAREAANLLRGRAIGCLPVVEEDALVGIITLTDMLALIGRGVEKALPETEKRPVSREHPGKKPVGSRISG